MNAATDQATESVQDALDIDVGNWPACSGASVDLYLRPAEERDEGRPLVYSFGHVGAGQPAAAFNHRELYLGTVGLDTDEETLEQWIREHSYTILALAEGYQGSEWDGHNRVGRWALDDDAQEGFRARLSRALDHGDIATYWSADDYFVDLHSDLLDAIVDDGIDAVVERETSEARVAGVLLRDESVRELCEQLVRDELENAEVDPYGENSDERVRRDRLRAAIGEAPQEVDVEGGTFLMPPRYGGHAVEFAFCGCEDGVVLKILDRSKRADSDARVTYYMIPWDLVENPEFHALAGEEPEVSGDWIDVVLKEE